jgi:hypothetical protein
MLTLEGRQPVRIFIGSGEASLIERKVLIYSLRQHTTRPLDIWVFNGTHNAVERNDEPPAPVPLSLRLKYRQKTEFSLLRYLIPELCQFRGRAIYLDSDMICLDDIGHLFDTPLDGYDFLAKADGYGEGYWAPSVMLIDCERARFDLEAIYDEIDRRLYSNLDFTRFSPEFRRHHSYRIGPLDPRWNEFDRYDEHSRLIHYTELMTQPWKFPGHPFGKLWFETFRAALQDGTVTSRDVRLSMQRAYVRPDLLEGDRTQWERLRGRAAAHLRRLKARQ